MKDVILRLDIEQNELRADGWLQCMSKSTLPCVNLLVGEDLSHQTGSTDRRNHVPVEMILAVPPFFAWILERQSEMPQNSDQESHRKNQDAARAYELGLNHIHMQLMNKNLSKVPGFDDLISGQQYCDSTIYKSGFSCTFESLDASTASIRQLQTQTNPRIAAKERGFITARMLNHTTNKVLEVAQAFGNLVDAFVPSTFTHSVMNKCHGAMQRLIKVRSVPVPFTACWITADQFERL